MIRDLKSQLMSGRMASAALEFVREGRTPVEPRPASTVILLRATAAGPEVYLLRRQRTMAFAAGMTVFPGGRVDADDASVADSWSGPSPSWFADRMGCSAESAAAFVAAAVRETFEESGVLLAGPSPTSVVGDTTGDDWEADRVALEAGELRFADFLHRRGLVLRADLLGPWAHWITPEFEPRRYDTRFFVAALPAGQVTRDVSSESDQVAWMRPADAVAAVESGELQMLPPTYICCRDLTPYDDVAAILTADRKIQPVLPAVRIDGNQAYLETT
jgi:8-oxo-dGTP pyrophosphatase MutT (NUDIX family)